MQTAEKPSANERQASPVPVSGTNAHETPQEEQYRPPYDLTSDMLVAIALLPTRPLRRAFPRVPFHSLLGRTPAIVWFSQVTDGWYSDANDQRCRLGDGHTPLYAELNVLVALWRRAIFVPGIYATSALSIQIGRRYGMPKQPIRMWFIETRDRRGRAAVAEALRNGRVNGCLSTVRAQPQSQPLDARRLLTAVAALALPRRSWPVRFPSGSAVRAAAERLLGAPGAHPTGATRRRRWMAPAPDAAPAGWPHCGGSPHVAPALPCCSPHDGAWRRKGLPWSSRYCHTRR